MPERHSAPCRRSMAHPYRTIDQLGVGVLNEGRFVSRSIWGTLTGCRALRSACGRWSTVTGDERVKASSRRLATCGKIEPCQLSQTRLRWANTNFVRSRALRLIVRAGHCRSSSRVFLLIRALATPSTQPTLSLGAASARALCGRAHGRRTERHDKPLHPLRSTRPERQAMPPPRTFIPRQALIR